MELVLPASSVGVKESGVRLMPMSVAAIIVAAGSSSRLGQPKQLVLIDGEPLLHRAIRFAQEAGASPVFVVLGAHRERIESAIDFGAAAIVINDGLGGGRGEFHSRGREGCAG